MLILCFYACALQQEYEFAQENPYQNTEDAFQKGLEKLKEGDLPSAILYFEAAVSLGSFPQTLQLHPLNSCQKFNMPEM